VIPSNIIDGTNLFIEFEKTGDVSLASDGFEFIAREAQSANAGLSEFDVGTVINRLIGKRDPVDEINQMCAHVGQRVALLFDIKKGDWSLKRLSSSHFLERMYAVKNADIALIRLTEKLPVLHQLAHQDIRDLIALGHHVPNHTTVSLGPFHQPFQLRK